MTPLLTARGLSVDYVSHGVPARAVHELDVDIGPGDTLAIVGESGCGKSTIALALMGLLPERESRWSAETLWIGETDLRVLDPIGWQAMRGARVAMVFQDPFSSLNPVLTIRRQVEECLPPGLTTPQRQRELEELLTRVQLPDPERLLSSFPHQLSGGQRQRIMIAMAIARRPALLIADEPTTALDVTVQDEIVRLLRRLQQEDGMAMLFITHNIALVPQVAERIAVMYAGLFVEEGPSHTVLTDPKHPYTQGLLRALPRLTPAKGLLPVMEGQPPEPNKRPSGCAFHPRCPRIFAPCDTHPPRPRRVDNDVRTRCHLYPENS